MKSRWMIFVMLAALAVMAIGMIGSGAWFTDTATNTTGALQSGTLSINNGKVAEHTLGTVANMAPGDVTDYVTIDIVNNGSIDLAWFGDLQVSNSPLKDVIYIDYAKMEFLSPGGAAWEPADEFILNGRGSGSWPTTWGGPENYATLTAFDGNANMAPGTPYEFKGALKPGYLYRLTLRFGFYPGAGNQYQGLGPMTIAFKVDATQIKAAALEAMYPYLGTAGDIPWLNAQIAKQTMP